MNKYVMIKRWAASFGIDFVSRSYGQYTTATVSMDSLLELVELATKDSKDLKLVGYVPAGDKDFTPPELRETIAAANLQHTNNAAQAEYWMDKCHLEVRPVYIGPALSNPPKQGQAQ